MTDESSTSGAVGNKVRSTGSMIPVNCSERDRKIFRESAGRGDLNGLIVEDRHGGCMEAPLGLFVFICSSGKTFRPHAGHFFKFTTSNRQLIASLSGGLGSSRFSASYTRYSASAHPSMAEWVSTNSVVDV